MRNIALVVLLDSSFFHRQRADVGLAREKTLYLWVSTGGNSTTACPDAGLQRFVLVSNSVCHLLVIPGRVDYLITDLKILAVGPLVYRPSS